MRSAPRLPSLQALESRIAFHAGHGDASESASPIVVDAAAATEVSLGWRAKRTLSVQRDEAAGAAVDGSLYVFGGFFAGGWNATSRVDRFDVARNEWARQRDMPAPLTHAATVVHDGKVWLLGGFKGANPGPAVRDVYIYDPKTDTYTDGPDLPEPRGAGAATIVGDTLIYFGGNDRGSGNMGDDKRTTWTLKLNDDDPTWARKRAMPTARNHVAAATVGGNAYAIGGQSGTEATATNQTSVARYNPKRDRWTRVSGLPGVVSHVLPSTVVYDGSILTFGGESSYNVSRNEIYRYDADDDEWSLYATLPKARRTPIVGLFGDELILTTGSYTGGIQTGETIRTRLPS